MSREGLAGQRLDGKVIQFIYPHGSPRTTRTVVFADGSFKDYGIYRLVGELIASR